MSDQIAKFAGKFAGAFYSGVVEGVGIACALWVLDASVTIQF